VTGVTADHPFSVDLRWPESIAPDFDRFEVRRGIGWIANPVLYSGHASRCRLAGNLGTETYAIRAYNRDGRWSPTIRRVSVTVSAPSGWTASGGDLPRDELAEAWPGTAVGIEAAPLPNVVAGSLHMAAGVLAGTYTTLALDAGSVDDWVWCASADLFQWWSAPIGVDGPVTSGIQDDWTGEGRAPSPLAPGAELEPIDWPWPIQDYPHPLRAPAGVLGRYTQGTVEARFSDDAVSWSGWGEWWTANTRRARYVQVRVTMRRQDPSVHDLHLLGLRVSAAAPPASTGGGPGGWARLFATMGG